MSRMGDDSSQKQWALDGRQWRKQERRKKPWSPEYSIEEALMDERRDGEINFEGLVDLLREKGVPGIEYMARLFPDDTGESAMNVNFCIVRAKVVDKSGRTGHAHLFVAHDMAHSGLEFRKEFYAPVVQAARALLARHDLDVPGSDNIRIDTNKAMFPGFVPPYFDLYVTYSELTGGADEYKASGCHYPINDKRNLIYCNFVNERIDRPEALLSRIAWDDVINLQNVTHSLHGVSLSR
jgi:hypothetical protein